MLILIEAALALIALLVALSLKPWRMLRGPLLSPALAAVALLPWLWLLPQKMPQGLQIQISGASLLVLMLGWPLAVPVLGLIGLAVWALGSNDAASVLTQVVWIGLAPATITLGLGVLMRHWLPPNLFVYTLGRGFLGTAVAVFLSGVMLEVLHRLVGGTVQEQVLVARWLMAWGDAFLTGMFTAVFVAFAPQWLATWSDERYLKPPAS